jgi:Cu/Ag efflux pump CusA
MLDRPCAWVRRHWQLAVLSLAGVALVAGALVLVLSTGQEEPHRPAPPTPAPVQAPVVQVVASFPGASAEEVERQVTIPLEIAFAGIPGLKTTLSRSLFALAHLDLEFQPGAEFDAARQEVINRLQLVQGLPPGVNPILVPAPRFSDELLRYTLRNPKNALHRHVYTLNDLRALQDWILEREFQRLPGLIFVSSAGGTVKRYEIHPDPDRLQRYGISLGQLQNAIASSNGNVGGDFLKQAQGLAVVRLRGLLGGGTDPLVKALALKSPGEAAASLRAEEARHLRELRGIVITQVNNVPVRVDDIVEGGPMPDGAAPGRRGVIVGHHQRLGQVSCARAGPAGKGWQSEEETVLGILLARKGDDSAARAAAVRARVGKLNTAAGPLLPGVKIVPYSGLAAPTETLWIRGDFPANISLEAASQQVRAVRTLLRQFPEVDAILSQLGRPEGGADPGPFSSVEIVVALKSPEDWPAPAGEDRPRTRPQLCTEIRRELDRKFLGVYSSYAADRAARVGPFDLGEGEHLVKVFGPDLAKLQELGEQVRDRLRALPGVEAVGVYGGRGASSLEFSVDSEKCRRWGIQVANVSNVLQLAIRGQVVTQMVLGEQVCDVTLRWPAHRRRGVESILDLPVDDSPRAGNLAAEAAPPAGGLAPLAKLGPRVRLRDLLSPVGDDGRPDPKGTFMRPGASVIYREQGDRLIAIKFRVSGRDPAAVRAEAERATAELFRAPYRAEWVGP